MERHSEVWLTTVDELVRLFRKALLVLIPIVEEAHIPWKEGEAYDQWDAIANVLFDKIVAEPLAWALDSVDKFSLAAYDLVVGHYRDVSFILVDHSSLPSDGPAALLRFVTSEDPLDLVEVAVLDSRLEPTGPTSRLAVAAVKFRLERLKEEGGRVAVDEVSVPE